MAFTPPDFWLESPIDKPWETAGDVYPFEGFFGAYRNYSHIAPRKLQKHEGIDLSVLQNGQLIPVIASQRGVVIETNNYPRGYGLYVVVSHDWYGMEYRTWYCHLSEIHVKKGQWVLAKEKVGIGGSTGYSTGPHLHYTLQHIGHGLKNYTVDDIIDPTNLFRQTQDLKPFDEAFPRNTADLKFEPIATTAGAATMKRFKIWNSGTMNWSQGYTLKFVEGDQMGGDLSVAIPPTPRGGLVEVCINVTAPANPGVHTGIWQVHNPLGQPIGYEFPVVLNVAGPRDEIIWVKDVTVPDGMAVRAGETFTKIWRVKNVGTTGLGNGYTLTHVKDEKMGAGTPVPLPSASIGGEIDIAVDLVAPSNPGKYRTTWKAKNAAGNLFEAELYAEIKVVGTAETSVPVNTKAAVFVADVTIPDGTPVQPGQKFTKTWRMRNEGASAWGTGFTLAFFSENQMGAPSTVPLPAAKPGEEVNVSVELTAPTTPGTAKSIWKPKDPLGNFFDYEMYCEVNVLAAGATAPAPATPTEVTGTCQMDYIADVTIPDGTVMVPGQKFTKTWKVRNMGTATWGSAFVMAFASGDPMGAPATVPLVEAFANQDIDISIQFTAPATPGVHRTAWKPKKPNGEFFDYEMYCEIEVKGGLKHELAYEADVTIPDGMEIPAGQKFVKTWRVINRGQSAWAEGFTLAFFKDEPMGAPASLPLPACEPGDSVDISIELTAPTAPGLYRSTWKPKDPLGNFFDFDLYAEITVK